MDEELSMDDIYSDDDGGSTEQAQAPSDDGLGGADMSAEDVDGDGGEDYAEPDGGQGGGVYASVARALMEDGILNTDVSGVDSADAFRQAMEAEINSRLTPLQQRVSAALGYGMRPDEIQQYESAMGEAQGYTDEMVADESDDGVELRKNLIYQGCLARGMSDAQAEREVDKSFKAGTDIDDAKDARDTVISAIRGRYDAAMRERAEAQRMEAASREGFNRALYDSVAQDDGRMFGKLTENTKRLVLGNMFDRCVRMGDGRMMTPIEAAAASDPVGFQKALSVAFTLTDGFRDFDKLGAVKANRAVKRGIEGLERALRGGSGKAGGSYRYANNADPGNGDDMEIIL